MHPLAGSAGHTGSAEQTPRGRGRPRIQRVVRIPFLLLVVCFAMEAARTARGQQPETGGYDHHGNSRRLPGVVEFNAHIRPVMSDVCFVCHGPDDAENNSGIRLDSFAAAVDQGGVIRPGAPESSTVWQRLHDADDPMPPAEFRHQLSEYEKALIGRWIQQGAGYQTHWAWAPLQQPAVPEPADPNGWLANPVDAFVLDRLQLAGLQPSPPADRRTALRRLSLDLTGLPPTPAEVQEFLEDSSPDAWQRQVDRLLASPHYGERMASRWLDIVRFSDTVGFHGDQNQRIFPYRDYVIESLNDNQPFDQFTREQLAADLLPDPAADQLVATGLIRLNMMTREGGAQPAEYLAKYSADRVRMVGTAWLGATTGCCECHNHKYDPFTIQDFYALGAFFDDVRQWGVYSDYGYTPNPDLRGFTNDHPFPPEMRISSESLEQEIRFLEQRLEEIASGRVTGSLQQDPEFVAWLEALVAAAAEQPDGWCRLPVSAVTGSGEPAAAIQADGSVLFSGPPLPGAVSRLELTVRQPRTVRSVRLEVLPDPANRGYTGRSPGGRFSVSAKLTHLPPLDADAAAVPVRPRYVRIELDGRQVLSLAEVEVLVESDDGQLQNIAGGGTATQSSVDHNGNPRLAIDGNPNGDYQAARSTTHTRLEQRPWWELDLGQHHRLHSIRIWNRTDGNYANRLQGFRLVLLDAQRNPVLVSRPELPAPDRVVEIPDSVSPETLRMPETIARVQADRFVPPRFSSGYPSPWIEGPWRSGPARWQLPADEAALPHTAVYHLDQSLLLETGDRLILELDSDDLGRVRLATSPLSRPVVGNAASARLASALRALGESTSPTRISGLSDPHRKAIRSAWYRHRTPFSADDPAVSALREDLARCRSGLAMTMISQPLPAEQIRQSRVLPRGNWQDPSGAPVVPNTPAFLPGYEPDPESRLTRLDLANWLVSPDNPLTPRHYVNRTWKHFFGSGLSGRLDDLGNQGEWPSHPRLLDWLAAEFRRDWDRKHIVRLIVTSNAYRQQAAVRDDLQEIDPYNRLLAQQSARRLEAETVRDNALAIAGLLQTGWVGGPSVFPEQPAGHFVDLQFPNRQYRAQTDGRQYRRGVYMHWQRTFLHPMLGNFDAPARDECVADRSRSNSPQQALTLLNDPVFVEAALAFADQLIQRDSQAGFASRMHDAWMRALARPPRPAELDGLQQLFLDQRRYYTRHPEEATALATAGSYQPQTDDRVELAALTQVCRVLLNLHETITRY